MRQLVCALAAVLAIAAPHAARAEPLDFELARIGPPTAEAWAEIVGTATADALARESRQRFAVLSTEMALALSSAMLHPASTTGHSGFDVDFEVATVAVHADAIGSPVPAPFTNRAWPSTGSPPSQLYLPSVHVRKALPFSLEFGGRMIYLAQSSYFGAQGEGKWALNEGFEYVPDVAVRVAYTRLFGPRDWNLGATDLDLVVSKRWGVNGVTSFTPYLAGRFTYVSASSERIEFAPTPPAPATAPEDLVKMQASFPRFSAGFYRTTLGLRFTANVVSLAVEATYFGGSRPSVSGYDGAKIASAFGGAAKLGWEF